MKRSIPFLLFMIAAVLCVCLLFRQREKAPQIMPFAQPQETNALIANNTMRQEPGVTKMSGAATSQQAIASEPSTEAELNAQVRKMLEARNHPVEFWGKVVDQDGVPLPDVKVETSINHFFWPPEQAPNGVTTNFELITDADGRFHVSDSSATGIHVMLQKAGYDQEERNGYGSNGQNGSPESPAILKMWNTNTHQQLITGEKSFQIEPDGRQYVIDLAKGTIAESGDGDLKVWVKRPEQITYGKRYDWSCGMDVLNGGLLAASDSEMYLAPTDGYVSSFEFEQKIGSGWGDSTGEKRFYVKLSDGQVYGRLIVELFAYYNDRVPGMVRVQYTINPSGSPILR